MTPNTVATQNLYADSVNPQWVRLLDLLGMTVRYVRCEGCELYAEDGTRYLKADNAQWAKSLQSPRG